MCQVYIWLVVSFGGMEPLVYMYMTENQHLYPRLFMREEVDLSPSKLQNDVPGLAHAFQVMDTGGPFY